MTTSQPRSTTTRVIGYVPAWKDLRQTVNGTDLNHLTHLNVAFLNPDIEGELLADGEPTCMQGATSADLRYLVETAHAANVKVLVSVAGGVIPACSGDWEQLLQPETRDDLVERLLHFVADFNLDGIDIDLEGRLLTTIDRAGNYTPFIEALSEALRPEGKLVTCATASYVGGMVPVESLPWFDFVNIMS